MHSLQSEPYSEEDDYDQWSEPDVWDDDESDVMPCPECGEQVYEFTDQCPYCRQYISLSTQTTSAWQGRPWWWILLACLGILGLLFTLWGAMRF